MEIEMAPGVTKIEKASKAGRWPNGGPQRGRGGGEKRMGHIPISDGAPAYRSSYPTW